MLSPVHQSSKNTPSAAPPSPKCLRTNICLPETAFFLLLPLFSCQGVNQGPGKKKPSHSAQTAHVAPMNKHSLPGSKILRIPNFPVIIHKLFCFLKI